ncbi:phage portal protein [Nocardioides marmoraquaticus]
MAQSAALTSDDQATLRRLRARLSRETRGYAVAGRKVRRLGFEALDAYYDGEQRLQQLGIAVPDDLREFVTIVGWPGTFVDTIVDRREVEGFRLAGRSNADSNLWAVWQANDLDSESPLARTDANVFGHAYYCVGTNPDDDATPLVTVESPLEMTHEWSSHHRRMTAVARFYTDVEDGKRIRRATYYAEGRTHWLRADRTGWVDEEDPDEHGFPIPVVPLVNGQRTHDRYGRSMMTRIIGLTDSAARALTIAQVATEVMGLPQRTAAGISKEDFKDPNTGRILTEWEAYLGAIWATGNKDAKFHQFSAAELSNFVTIVGHYAQLVSGLTGLPMRYLGQLSDNPPSADGIRADESRLVRLCERQNTAEAGTLEDVMRLVRRFQTGVDDPKLRGLETEHRDPSTPTKAQAADAAVKLRQQRIISLRQARKDLGYSNVQIRNMERDDREERSDATLDGIARGLLDLGADPDAGPGADPDRT